MTQIDGQMTQNGHQNGQLRWAIARGSVTLCLTASCRMITFKIDEVSETPEERATRVEEEARV